MVLVLRILKIALVLICAALMVLVLLQEGKNAGLGGGIAGGNNSQSYVGKHRADTPEGKMERITAILVAVFFIVALLLNYLAN